LVLSGSVRQEEGVSGLAERQSSTRSRHGVRWANCRRGIPRIPPEISGERYRLRTRELDHKRDCYARQLKAFIDQISVASRHPPLVVKTSSDNGCDELPRYP
jgi:hypothetical protein